MQITEKPISQYVVLFGNPMEFFSDSEIQDIDFALETLDSTLFPGISSSIEAHSGFANEQAK